MGSIAAVNIRLALRFAVHILKLEINRFVGVKCVRLNLSFIKRA